MSAIDQKLQDFFTSDGFLSAFATGFGLTLGVGIALWLVAEFLDLDLLKPFRK